MKTKYTIIAAIVVITIIVGSIFAYNQLSQPASSPSPSSTGIPTSTPTATPQSMVTLTGAGATFPYPLLSAMITEYTNLPGKNIQINYQPIGSGGGIKALQDKTADFAGSDAPLSTSDVAKAPNTLHIPETIGAVTIAYRLPGVSTALKLTGSIIADIFAGTITMWNDAAIQNLNPSMTLPAQSILVVHRSDGSGTTFIFTGYLSKVSTSWNSTIGQGKTVSWPVGIGSSGNTGVASVVQGQNYAVGYVELAYALQNNMTVAAVQNPAGNYIMPTLESTTLAAQSGASSGLPTGDQSWTNVNILNTADAQAYPIVSFSYLMVYKELNVISGMTQEKATALVQFLWYVVHDGQQSAADLEYAALPSNVVQTNEATIQSITFNGQFLPTS
jgi:phosphate transport system substrate-binding protein